MHQVTTANQAPYNAIGRLKATFFNDDDSMLTKWGTAFLIGNGGVILTAAHTLVNNDRPASDVEFIIGTRSKVVFPWALHSGYQPGQPKRTVHDIAIGKLDSPFGGIQSLELQAMEADMALENTPVSVVGYEGGIMYQSSVVVTAWPLDHERTVPFRYQANSTTHGMSGGPVIDPNNRVIGVISGHVDQDNVDVAAPIMQGIGNRACEFIQAFLEQHS